MGFAHHEFTKLPSISMMGSAHHRFSKLTGIFRMGEAHPTVFYIRQT